ncbi:calcium-binding protein [uncultured Jannaschia sp.]|uniref:calcium-binding protein n=1 Tax=uncultured Jannaschia sp. TaxID=293347 RepID=UPI0026124847|nr:calcium-binding protein [uncultured Jannaschia sp.]
MAILLSPSSFDWRALNLHRLRDLAIEHALIEDENVEAYGELIPDLFPLYRDGGRAISLFGGCGLDEDEGFLEDGTVTLYADLYSSAGSLWAEWELTDIAVSASSILDVSTTQTSYDDRQLFQSVLSSDDYFGLSNGKDFVYGFGGADWIEGYDGNDRLFGGVGRDVVNGGDGKDRISGGDGRDHVHGGTGRDRLILDEGNDRMNGGEGSDWLVVNGKTAARVDLASEEAQHTGYGRDTIIDIENVIGSRRGDRIFGTEEANRLEGEEGYDKLWGRDGRDWLYGGDGNDRLSGGSGDDHLFGGSGADILIGGQGRDSLHGGRDKDRDTFVFRSADESRAGADRDDLREFCSSEDVIHLGGIDADTSQEGNQSFALSDDGRAANAVWLLEKNDGILLRADVNGNARADFEILIRGVNALDEGALIL